MSKMISDVVLYSALSEYDGFPHTKVAIREPLSRPGYFFLVGWLWIGRVCLSE